MRSIWISLAALTTILFASDARAFAPDGPTAGFVMRASDVRTTSAGVWTTPQRATTAFTRFVTATGPWQSVWDRDTGVPSRLWGRGILVPGAQKNPAAAAAAARLLIEAHLDLFAPGTSPGELELIGNSETADLRRVTFAQRWRGMRVVGGTVVAMFKRDRLIVLGSSALPDVSASIPTSATAPSATAARRWVTAASGLDVAVATTGAPEVFAEVRPGDIRYTVVRPLVVEATAGVGKWTVWIDAATGEPIARVSRIMFGDGQLTYGTPEREAPGPRIQHPAAFVTLMVDGAPVTSTFAGRVSWPGTALASVVTSTTGPYAIVADGGGHPMATTTLSLTDGGTAGWDLPTDEFGDGQITTFTHVNVVKAFIRHEMNPFLPWVDSQMMVSANENNLCNAFADLDPDQVHFFINGDGGFGLCENTGRIPDVVYHEAGHNFHFRSMLQTGAITDINGFFTNPDVPGLSEGLGDTLATALTASPIIGPGFFVGDPNGIRNLDPVGTEKRYPQDLQGEPHADGEIIGGAIWDLRKALVISLGEQRGQYVTNRAFRGVISNSIAFTETYADALAADDDDGNLANGTPHQCDISRAFEAHGLAPSLAGGVEIGTPRIDAGSFVVPIATPAADCPGLTVTGVTIAWQVRGDASMSGTVALTPGAAWTGTVPVLADGTVIQYDVEVTFSDASTTTRPLNQADPYYEAYLGAVTPIFCDDFEADNGWTHAATTGVDEWARGAGVAPAAGDPDGPVSGSAIFGTDIADNGLYTAMTDTYAETPSIDVRGFATVRLQYRRWLDVDDGFLDQATISVGGTELWHNLAGDAATATNVHRDREWRFQDLDLTAQAASGMLAVRFGLVADATTQYGGWSMDDVCVVGIGAVCGDTFMRGSEECDDGNVEDGDGCSALCVTEIPGEGGCCSTGTDPRGALVVAGFGALGLLGVLRRRRKR